MRITNYRYFFSNHDQPRQWDRYGDGIHNDQIAKLMATLLLTTRGTPQMYYGEELGMRTTPPATIEEVHDPIGKLGWPKEKGRDGERTPMQWTPGSQSGFTTAAKPWLPIPPSAATYNVDTERADPNSIFNAYKRLLFLRKNDPALHDGTQESINDDDSHVFSYLRRTDKETVLVSLNMSAEPRSVIVQVGTARQAQVLYRTYGPATGTVELTKILLEPYGVLVARIK